MILHLLLYKKYFSVQNTFFSSRFSCPTLVIFIFTGKSGTAKTISNFRIIENFPEIVKLAQIAKLVQQNTSQLLNLHQKMSEITILREKMQKFTLFSENRSLFVTSKHVF